MFDKKRFFYIGISLSLVLFLSGCGPAAPPETRAGSWTANSDLGEIAFTVSPDGSGITAIEYSVIITPKCSSKMLSGSMTLHQTASIDPPGLSIKSGKFSYDDGTVKVEGTFGRDGASASGSLSYGDCSSRWKTARTSSVPARPSATVRPTLA